MKTITGTIIKIVHIGEDYGKVEVTFPSGDTQEYEVARGLALILSKVE